MRIWEARALGRAWERAQGGDWGCGWGDAPLAHPPHHRGRCGPPRPSQARWLTPPGSPVGRSPSTRPTTGAVWGQTSGPGPARQGRGHPHAVRAAGATSATASATTPLVPAARAARWGWATMPGDTGWGLTTGEQGAHVHLGVGSSPVFARDPTLFVVTHLSYLWSVPIPHSQPVGSWAADPAPGLQEWAQISAGQSEHGTCPSCTMIG